MSKFFTGIPGLLLALASCLLASEEMIPVAPTVAQPASPEGWTGLPEPLKAERFATLSKKSPFTLASAPQENADFAKDLMLAGYVRMDGQDFVMVANRTRADRIMVGTKPSPSAQGMVLLKIERDPSGDPTKMQARVRKGTEEATLKYEASPSAATPVAVPGTAPVPGQPPPVAGQPPGVPQPGQAGIKNPALIRRRNIPIPAPTR